MDWTAARKICPRASARSCHSVSAFWLWMAQAPGKIRSKSMKMPIACIRDNYLLLDKGAVAKTAWINPQGGRLGRQVGVWTDQRNFKEVIIPWLVHTLKPVE